MSFALVDNEGRVLVETKPTSPSPEVTEEPLHLIASREAAKQSTKKHHPFTTHHTYTGAGCAICGEDHHQEK